MPLPVIPSVFRVVMEWEKFRGVAPRNIVHLLDTSGTRDETGIASSFVASFAGGMIYPVNNGRSLGKLYVIKLDGTSAGIRYTFTPILGSATGEDIPASAAVVSFRTVVRGPRGRGRLYIGPICEDMQSAGALNPTAASNMLTAWQTINSTLLGLTPPIEMGIASYRHADFHPLTNISVDAVVGVQRRRNNQTR